MQRLLGGLVRESAAAQHLLRDTDGIAGGRRRPEHAFIVVLRQDEDRQPRLPVPQHLLLLRPEPARALDARRLRQDGAQTRREVQLLEGEPGELGQRAIEVIPGHHGRATADLVRRVGPAVGTGQAQHLAGLLLVDDGRIEPLAVTGEVPADAVRHLAEVGLRALQDHRRGRRASRHDHDLGVDCAAAGGFPVVLVIDDVVVHPVQTIGFGYLLHLVQRPDLRAVRDRRGQVVQQQRPFRVEAAAGHHPVAVGALRDVDRDVGQVGGPPGMVAGGGPQATGVRDLLPGLMTDRQSLGHPVVPGVQGVTVDDRRPHPPAYAALALEHEPRRSRHRGEVHHAATADAVAAEHAHAVACDEVEDPRAGRAKLEAVVKLVTRNPRPALQNHHLGPARR